MKTMERLVSWSVSEDGIVQFRYEIDGKLFRFCVNRETMADVLRDVGRMAANPACPVSWNDAAYLTSMIREVVNMLDPPEPDDDGCVYAQSDVYSIAWSIMTAGCFACICLTLFVFVMWGR